MAIATSKIELADISDEDFLKELEERCSGRGPMDERAREFRRDAKYVLKNALLKKVKWMRALPPRMMP